MELLQRCEKAHGCLGIPVTVICRKVGISPQAYYKWRNGSLRLSQPTLERIETYLQQINF